MVKNYLVSAVRPIANGWHIESNRDLYKAYQEMYKMSLASFRHFCQEPFEAICWGDEVQDNEQYTVENWRVIRELWHKEPCNIFWAGADTLMIRPTNIFNDRFKEYRMFNYTDPKRHEDYPNYFNNDVQWFPSTMEPSIWNLGDRLWEGLSQHPDRNWGFDQLRNNAMFWAQPIPDDDRLHPAMAYQAMNLRQLTTAAVAWHDIWNQISINQAHILHFHASRGSQQVIALMQQISQQLGI